MFKIEHGFAHSYCVHPAQSSHLRSRNSSLRGMQLGPAFEASRLVLPDFSQMSQPSTTSPPSPTHTVLKCFSYLLLYQSLSIYSSPTPSQFPFPSFSLLHPQPNCFHPILHTSLFQTSPPSIPTPFLPFLQPTFPPALFSLAQFLYLSWLGIPD